MYSGKAAVWDNIKERLVLNRLTGSRLVGRKGGPVTCFTPGLLFGVNLTHIWGSEKLPQDGGEATNHDAPAKYAKHE
eukprot:2844462-Amphidinium_carterae.1